MPKYLNNIDLAKNQLLNGVIQNLASAPAGPVKGQFYFDTVSNHEYVYNGTVWEQASGGGGAGTVTTVSVATANGFAGTVASATSTPAITLTTSVTGLLKGNGTALSAAAGTDLPALNTITAPTAALSLNSQRITNLLDPTGPQDAATKNYVDVGIQANLRVVGKYQATIGDGTTTSFNITQATHGLAADSSIHAMVLDDTSGAIVFPDIAINKTNGTVTLMFAAAPTANQYRVVLLG